MENNSILKGLPKENDIRENRKSYLKYFLGSNLVLDVGCGNGSFLELLNEKGINATGIDLDQECVDSCKENKLNVQRDNALAFLEGKNELYNGIFCSHLIEHLSSDDAVKLVQLMYRSLRKNGVIVFVTPNCENIEVMTRIFWNDLTHKRPYSRCALENIFRKAGFSIVAQGENVDSIKQLSLIKKVLNKIKNTVIGRYWGAYDYYIVGRKEML